MADPAAGFAWTEARIERLKQMWRDGYSASVIAAGLAESDEPCSRMAVLGKRLRLGLPSRKPSVTKANTALPAAVLAATASQSRPKLTRSSSQGLTTKVLAARRKQEMAALECEPIPDSDADQKIPIRQRKTIMTLTATSCRWPVNDPRSPDFFFCGGFAASGLYCLAHTARAWRGPMSEDEQRRRRDQAVESYHRRSKRSAA